MEITFDRRQRKMRRITLLPMINVIFLLLAFFLVTGGGEVGGATSVALPKISGGAQPDTGAVELRLDAAGKAYINGNETAASLVEVAMVEKLRQTGGSKVTIQADSRLEAAKIINMMQAIQKAQPAVDVAIMVQTAGVK